MARYLSYVRNFTEQVYMDKGFLAEMETQAAAIEDAVKADSIGQLTDFGKEKTPAAERWQDFNLLALMKARGEEVIKQLDALDAGKFPRRDHQVLEWETCQDWRKTDPPGQLLNDAGTVFSVMKWLALTATATASVLAWSY